MTDPFGDIPLFRELQKVLSSTSGPVNMEIARQVAMAMVASAPGGPPGAELEAPHAAAVHEAEQLVAGYSRLSLDEPARTQSLTPSAWVESTLRAWGWLFESLASGFSDLLGSENGPEQEAAGMMGQIVPLMTGLQSGALVGHLAQEALYRYELPVPRDDDGRLYLIPANLQKAAADYSLDATELVRWIATRQVGHALIRSHAPWIERYARSAFLELTASVEVDLSELQRKMMELQSGGFQDLEGLGGNELIPVVQTERHKMAHDRLQAFVATTEGYAIHVSEQVGSAVIPGAPKIGEAMDRRAAAPSEGRKGLSTVLGLELDGDQTAAGVTFCAAVVKLHGIGALNRIWEAPDNLPTLGEIKDPFAWMERVLDA